jgi:hypothetical protein
MSVYNKASVFGDPGEEWRWVIGREVWADGPERSSTQKHAAAQHENEGCCINITSRS